MWGGLGGGGEQRGGWAGGEGGGRGVVTVGDGGGGGGFHGGGGGGGGFYGGGGGGGLEAMAQEIEEQGADEVGALARDEGYVVGSRSARRAESNGVGIHHRLCGL